MSEARVPIKLEIHDRTVSLSVEPRYAEVFRLMSEVGEVWRRRREGSKAVAEKVVAVLANCSGVIAVRVISYVWCNGHYMVLVGAKSLGSSMDIEYVLDDTFGKQYTVHGKVDGVIVRVSVVHSEMYQQAVRHSTTFFTPWNKPV